MDQQLSSIKVTHNMRYIRIQGINHPSMQLVKKISEQLCHIQYQYCIQTRAPSLVSPDNIFISWTWLSGNFCCRFRGTWQTDSLICLVEFHLNFTFLHIV